MEKNKHRLLNQSGCLTRETVLAWLENRLSPAEKMLVGEHLRECILCREALEGFSASDASRVRAGFADINHAMQQRLLQQEKKGLSRSMKLSLAAAVLLVLIGIFSIFRFKPLEAPLQVAQEMQLNEHKAKAPAPLPEEKIVPQEKAMEKSAPASNGMEMEEQDMKSSKEEVVVEIAEVERVAAAPQPKTMAAVDEDKDKSPVEAEEENSSMAYNAPADAKKSEAPAMARSARYAEKSVAVEYSSNSETTFYVVDNPPKFQGGDLRKFKAYVEGAVAASTEKDQLKSGTMALTFTVDKTGKVKDVFVTNGLDAKTNSVVKEIVQKSSGWQAGRQQGKPVNVNMVLQLELK